MNWTELGKEVLDGKQLTQEEALAILTCDDDELLPLLHGAFLIRKHYFGKLVKLNKIINTKSGLCPEDCGYCSQSSVSTAPIEKYTMMDKDAIVEGAEKAYNQNVRTYCIVASGRGPLQRDLDTVIEAVKEIKSSYNMKICACLGILNDKQAKSLKEAGVERYNHNVNTSSDHHENITQSHTYDDRISTLEKVKEAGISPCSGVIVGMGESHKDIVKMAEALREIDADSIPVNFLHAIPGTPLEHLDELNPRFCLKVLALFRFINPTKEIRISGGREVNLRSLQPLGLYAANSIFVGDYLTTDGQETTADHQLLEDLGFEIDFLNEPVTV
ncbi:biotin synthase [Fictibacillus macauensis ZFHKF-1]|uniref:Biotin synthase n=1 Tax=Fictibacillus macauensis ZFHKF-1 TaxID=1196324 RepID=I8AIU0_9BACL|nr:biotin synthase BioB [Fictibacillus macauensis]EIT85404.1 biotin synthase [Fictibacillus macauensis ZFHKF-1]